MGTDAVASALDSPQRLTDLPDFGAAQLVEPLQHLVVFQFAGAFLPVTIMRRPEFPLDLPDPPQESIEPFLQEHSDSTTADPAAAF